MTDQPDSKLRTGLADPLLWQLYSQICANLGMDAAAQPPLYRQLALAALDDAEKMILTYLVSHEKNTRRSRGQLNKNKGARIHG